MNRTAVGILSLLLTIAMVLLVHGCDFLRPEEYDSQEFSTPRVDRSAAYTTLPNMVTSRDTILIRSNSAFQVTTLSSINSYAISTPATPITFEERGDTMLIINVGVIDPNLAINRRGISNSTNLTVSLYINPSLINTRAMATMVARSMIDTATEYEIIHLKFSELIDSLRPLAHDTLIFMRYPDSQRVSYAKITVNQSGSVYLYTQFDLPRFAAIELINSDTTLVSYTNITETEAIYIQTETGAAPLMRYKYHLAAGNYIVRLRLTDDAPLVGGVFKLLLLPL